MLADTGVIKTLYQGLFMAAHEPAAIPTKGKKNKKGGGFSHRPLIS
jgi:hypothetical protein